MSRVAQKCGRAGGVCGRRAWGGCGASESRTCQNLQNARSIEQVFDGAMCVRRFGNLLNAASILQVAVVHQTILVRHAIQSVDARRGGALEVKKTPAQCCERLAGHEGAMSQRVRLAVLFLVNAPITTATVPRGAYGPTRKSGGFAIWRPAMFRTGFV